MCVRVRMHICVCEWVNEWMGGWVGGWERQTETETERQRDPTDRLRVTLTYLNEQANSAFQWGNKRLIQTKILIQWYLQLKLQWVNSTSANIPLQCLHKHKCLQGGSIDIQIKKVISIRIRLGWPFVKCTLGILRHSTLSPQNYCLWRW